MKSAVILLSFVILITGCGAHDAIEATKGMPKKMDEMSGKLDRTETALGRVFSFEALLKDQYGKNLIPVPFDLMPFAREFAKYAPAEELAEVVYLWTRKINEVTLDLPNPTPEDVFAFDWRKMHVQAALQAVCGFIPRAKLDQIIQEQIYGSGRYADATLNLLMFRVRFLRDAMLGASLLSEKMNDVGDLEKAVEYAEEIDYIARLRFAPMIGVELTGFKNNDMDVFENFDRMDAVKIWQKIKFKADTNLKVEIKDISGTPGENEKLYQAKQARFNKAMGTVLQRISEWGTNKP